MLTIQKDKFNLPEDVIYLNGAFMSPQLNTVTQVGLEAVQKKELPYLMSSNDFFNDSIRLRQLFAKLIDAPDYQNTAIIPSASYGIATVAKNICLQPNQEILIVGEQFPSNVYVWKEIAKQKGGQVKIVSAPKLKKDRGREWNNNILKSINNKTKIVAIPHIHWADGTFFDLKSIRKKTNEYNCLLIIDGSQSIGALPFSVKEIQPDALITVGYKWMLGSYSLGMAYFSDYFNSGEPIEYGWLNRKNSEDFTRLVNYQEEYQPKAGRYNMGEYSNFIAVPMLIKAIEQLILWQPCNIQEYCKSISEDAIKTLVELGCFIEEEDYRAHHLFGVYLPEYMQLESLIKLFKEKNIYVSVRGSAIRISSNLYNCKNDFSTLTNCFQNQKK